MIDSNICNIAHFVITAASLWLIHIFDIPIGISLIERLGHGLLQRQLASFSPGSLEGRLIELSARHRDHVIDLPFVSWQMEGSQSLQGSF
jgi:hypothetical protein